MTANLRMIIDNYADSATLTANPAVVSTLPVTYLQDSSRGRVMRTTSTAAQEIKATWTGTKIISAVALVRNNFSAAATWRIQIYSDAAWTTQVYDSGTVAVYATFGLGEFVWGIDPLGASIFTNWDQKFSVNWNAAIGGQSLKITITDTANADGYLQASRLFIGNYFEAAVNMDYGLDMHWEENTTQTRTAGGTLRSDQGVAFRVWDIKLGWLNAGERSVLVESVRKVGMRTDMFLSCFPEAGTTKERDYSGQVKLARMPPMAHHMVNFWNTSLSLQEA